LEFKKNISRDIFIIPKLIKYFLYIYLGSFQFLKQRQNSFLNK